VADNYKRVLCESFKRKIQDYQDVISRMEAGRKAQKAPEKAKKQQLHQWKLLLR
jgi:hypothetical protein